MNPGLKTCEDRNEKQVFQERPQTPLPPDHLKMSMKIEKMEEKFETILS